MLCADLQGAQLSEAGRAKIERMFTAPVAAAPDHFLVVRNFGVTAPPHSGNGDEFYVLYQELAGVDLRTLHFERLPGMKRQVRFVVRDAKIEGAAPEPRVDVEATLRFAETEGLGDSIDSW